MEKKKQKKNKTMQPRFHCDNSLTVQDNLHCKRPRPPTPKVRLKQYSLFFVESIHVCFFLLKLNPIKSFHDEPQLCLFSTVRLKIAVNK